VEAGRSVKAALNSPGCSIRPSPTLLAEASAKASIAREASVKACLRQGFGRRCIFGEQADIGLLHCPAKTGPNFWDEGSIPSLSA